MRSVECRYRISKKPKDPPPSIGWYLNRWLANQDYKIKLTLRNNSKSTSSSVFWYTSFTQEALSSSLRFSPTTFNLDIFEAKSAITSLPLSLLMLMNYTNTYQSHTDHNMTQMPNQHNIKNPISNKKHEIQTCFSSPHNGIATKIKFLKNSLRPRFWPQHQGFWGLHISRIYLQFPTISKTVTKLQSRPQFETLTKRNLHGTLSYEAPLVWTDSEAMDRKQESPNDQTCLQLFLFQLQNESIWEMKNNWMRRREKYY